MSSEATQGQLPDVYGQVHPIETPELIEEKLVALHKELAQLPQEKTKAWKQAQEQCPQLVDQEFELQFLRCEVFNADVSGFSCRCCCLAAVHCFGWEFNNTQMLIIAVISTSLLLNDWSSIGKNESKFLVPRPFSR